jgi:hypothetical protein
MDFNTLDKESMMDIFFGWYTRTYMRYPLALYINLLQVSDWNYFHPENKSTVMKEIYYKQKYSQYFTSQDFSEALQVIRRFITENVNYKSTETLTLS